MTSRIADLSIEDHFITVPLVWYDDSDERTIDVYAAVVSRPGGENLPYLVFLQGGPGNEAPRPYRCPTQPTWLDVALENYRVVMLDQRGTGKSTPIGDNELSNGTDWVVDRLRYMRADSIVEDAEAMREHLGVKKWTTLGQSFGGFTTLAYLTKHPESLTQCFFTGGLSAVGHHPDDVYSLCYKKMKANSLAYYRRFPEHREKMGELADLAAEGKIVLPTGEVLSVSRLRSLGHLLGSTDGWQDLYNILERDPKTNAFKYALSDAMPFGGSNPLYYVIHESSYSDGFVTDWSAERTFPEEFREDVTLLTGEHVWREWTQTVPALQPWAEVVDKVAQIEWPSIYDAKMISESGVSGAAAVYFNDVYVPLEFSVETGALLPGIKKWVTSEYEHNGLRCSNGLVLQHLFDLASGKRVAS